MLSPTSTAVVYCISAGGLAALASCFGKLAGLDRKLALPVKTVLPSFRNQWTLGATSYGLLFLCNSAVSTLQLKALRELPSLQGSVIITASNLTLTVLMGHILFGEILGGRQLLGAVLLLLGALLVSTARTQQESVVPCKEKKAV